MSNIKENNAEYDDKLIKAGDETKTGNATSTELSRLQSRVDNPNDNLSDDELKRYNELKGGEKRELTKIDIRKRTQMNAGTQNVYKKKHNKYGNNIETIKDTGTEVKIEKIGKSGEHSKISDNIKYNRVQTYESINEEIDSMRYLIEYMNNKNNIII